MSRKDKEVAHLMRKQGKSYREIKNELKIPMSTLSDWFGGSDWSQDIRRKLSHEIQEKGRVRLNNLNKVRGAHLKRAYAEAREEAAAELNHLKYNPLFISGIMLYWGEGDKLTKSNVSLTNTDPKMLKLFVSFLMNVCGVPKSRIRAHVLLYPDLEDWLCKVYWSQETGLSQEHFTKSTVIKGRHLTRKLSFGICIVTVSSSYMKVKMLEWIRLLPKELMDRQYYEKIAAEAAMV